jgi:hypothetical protein
VLLDDAVLVLLDETTVLVPLPDAAPPLAPAPSPASGDSPRRGSNFSHSWPHADAHRTGKRNTSAERRTSTPARFPWAIEPASAEFIGRMVSREHLGSNQAAADSE